MTGLLTDGLGTSQSVSVVVGSRADNSSHTVTVTNNIHCQDHMVREEEEEIISQHLSRQVNLTLRSVSGGDQRLTKMIPCISYSMREATTPSYRNNNYVGRAGKKECLDCLDSWIYWLQPQHWIGKFSFFQN